MKYKIDIRTIWECGQRVDSQGNPHQEDSIFPAHNNYKDTDRLFILCDGMGGHAAGEVASSTVCETISKSVLAAAPDTEGDFTDEVLQKAIDDAFDALDKLDNDETSTAKKMGTTMTFLKLHSKGCTIAHMGDSRVYHIRPGKGKDETQILFQTKDHSLVNALIAVGELTPEDAKKSKQKNVITRAMQPTMEMRPKADVYHTADIRKGDYFYLCSDGMLENMDDDNICFNFSEKTGTIENKANMLTQATDQNQDNHSGILIQILDVIDPLPVKETNIVLPEPVMDKVVERVAKTEVKKRNGTPKIIRMIIAAILTLAAVAGFYYLSSHLSQKKGEEKSKEGDTLTTIQTKKQQGKINNAATNAPVKPKPSANTNSQSENANAANQQNTENVGVSNRIVSLGNRDNSSEVADDVVSSDEQKTREAVTKK